jgi:hypothetical protein
MGALPYLPYVIVEVVVVYTIVLGVFYWLARRKTYTTFQKTDIESPTKDDNNDEVGLQREIVQVKHFEDAYQVVWAPKSFTASLLLCVARFAVFCFFLGYVLIWAPATNGASSYRFFTYWNILTIDIYYLAAFISSVIGLTVDMENISDVRWRDFLLHFRDFVEIMFEVMGATAIFITVVNFILLNPSFEDFLNVATHFLNTIAMFIEMSVNSLYVRVDHYPYSCTWSLAFLIVTWAIRAAGTFDWPYNFLKADTPSCFAWYFALFVMDFLFYCLWYGVSGLKRRAVDKIFDRSSEQENQQCDGELMSGQGEVQLSPMGSNHDLPESKGDIVVKGNQVAAEEV